MSGANDNAVIALMTLLRELPAEFSDGPPDIKGEGREFFTVAKMRNVRTVHQALWDLQEYFGVANGDD